MGKSIKADAYINLPAALHLPYFWPAPFSAAKFCDTMSESESKKAKLASDGSDTFLAIGPFIMKEEETQHEISAMH